MPKRAATWAWIVTGTFVIAGSAFWIRATPGWDYESSGALAVGVVILGATIAIVLRLSRR